MKKIVSLILVAVLAFSAFSLFGCKKEQSDLEYVKEKGELIIGVTDFAPMDYQENGEWIGFDADYAKAFCEYIGVKAKIIEITWDNKESELDGKTIDCVWNGMTLTPGVMEAMETSVAYCDNAQVVVLNKDIAGQYKTADAIKTLSFAVEQGSAGDNLITDAGVEKITRLESQADALMEVAAGTSQACVIDLLMANSMTGEGTSYPDLTYTVRLNSEQYGVGFRKGSDLAAKLNEFFKKACSDGTAQELAAKYKIGSALINVK